MIHGCRLSLPAGNTHLQIGAPTQLLQHLVCPYSCVNHFQCQSILVQKGFCALDSGGQSDNDKQAQGQG